VQQAFALGAASWREAVKAAMSAGIVDPRWLADLVFFMQHPERMVRGVGKPIDAKEPGFHKLSPEWDLYLTIVMRILDPSLKPSVFLPTRESRNYEDFVAAPTTGRITLMLNGRNSDGTGHRKSASSDILVGGFKDDVSTFDQMQEAVEALGDGDFVYLANWQFAPTAVPLTIARSGVADWGALFAKKAAQGVKVRVIIAQHPSVSPFMADFAPLNAVIAGIADAKRDNFKYLVSAHAHALGVHHQKFMVTRKGERTVAFCGGLDISFNRTPKPGTAGGDPHWSLGFVWHDVGAKLEGLITHDLEREFVEHWNRERDKSTTKPLAGWKPFETLTRGALGRADRKADANEQPVQMLRTVSVGPDPSNIRRDDIWRGYFRLIGRARRFLYLENQYFHEPKLADAIVKQAEAQPNLVVMIVVGTGTDDPANAYTQHALALRLEFFNRLRPLAPSGPSLAGSKRLRVYTLNYAGGITHTKLVLVDDEALTVGSANANPRGFFYDSELNVVLDDAKTVTAFRHRLWAHELAVPAAEVARWSEAQYFARWDAVAKANAAFKKSNELEKMTGEGVMAFDPLDSHDPNFREGSRTIIGLVPPDVLF